MPVSRSKSISLAGPSAILKRVRRTFGEHATRLARRLTRGRPHLLVVLATLGVLLAAWFLAFLLRFEFAIPVRQGRYMALTGPFMLLLYCVSLYANGVFRILRRYMAVRDVVIVLRGTVAGTAVLMVTNAALLPPASIPQSVILLHGILAHLGVCAFFLTIRLLREAHARPERGAIPPIPVLIVGAGDSGDALLREIERATPPPARVLGFVDDDTEKHGGLLRGIPVLGGIDDLIEIARKLSVRQVIVALPSVGGDLLRKIVSPLLEVGLTVKVLPSRIGLSTTRPLLPQLRAVAIEDLLRRDPVRLDVERFEEYLRGKCILVTGAAGSIGMELCRQVLRYHPARLVALDCAETPLHDLMLEIGNGHYPGIVFPEMGDVTDPARILSLFSKHAPDVVFHAAALKHVPVCEQHPREAVRVNIGGTKIVARQAIRSSVDLFILISTDKAVNPSSVMGATKRAAEIMLQALSTEGSRTRFAAVRFGNVLGSNGSVLRIFKAQLERGGPLTVTHPDMRRYFMTIPEAVALVLQAAFQAEGGEIFELDMGAPVRIVDLADDFIRLSGLTPGRDIEIEYTGVRPGEKLFEELYLHSETVMPTSHPKVFCLKRSDSGKPDPAVQFCLDRLGPVDPANDPELARLDLECQGMLRASPVERAGIP